MYVPFLKVDKIYEVRCMYYNPNMGSIEIICGPMFAGKTEELVRRIKRMEYAKKRFVVFKPEIDDRYSEKEIVSHSNLRWDAISIKKSMEIYQYVTADINCVVIDEVQFFDEDVVRIVEDLANRGLRVICAGLDQDFKSEPFGVVPELLAKADFVTKLTAICSVCGAPATKTQRIVNGKPASIDEKQILVGANESYEPRCRRCHVVLK